MEMTQEEISEFSKKVSEHILRGYENPITFEREKHKESKENREANLWFHFYCNFIQFPDIHRDDIPELADNAVKEFKARYNC